MSIGKGDKVKWTWGSGEAKGTVRETYQRSVTRPI